MGYNTGCAIIHAGDVWFGTRRPGQVIEREGVASEPSISYSTQAISGPGVRFWCAIALQESP